jgi:glycosyltransferase involved in cell wall biosynthesis
VAEQREIVPGLVSVVICAWNNWPDLEMTIESALHQSYQPIEVIVVDNSSTDATAEEVAGRFGQDVQYIQQPNKGDAGAYNAGFRLTHGEFIQFVDGDDVLAPNKVEKQVEIFRADPEVDIVYGDARMFQTLPETATWIDPATKSETDIWDSLISSHVGISALGTLWRRRSIERVGPWDESLYVADLDYLFRSAWAGCKFAHSPGGPMGFSRVRRGQMTANLALIAQGIEAVLVKALGYVTLEPYRGLIAAELARHRFNMALSKVITKQEALSILANARASSPGTVSMSMYIATRAGILVPAIRTPWLRKMRRWVVHRFGFGSPDISGAKGATISTKGAGQ